MRRLATSTRHLYERSGAYYFRRVVPLELQKIMRRGEWQCSIGKKSLVSLSDAEARAKELTDATDETLSVVRVSLARIADIERDIAAISLTFPNAPIRSIPLRNETVEPLSCAYRYVEKTHPVSCEKHRAIVVRHFIQIMGDQDVLTLKRRDVLEFINRYRERNYSHSTLRRRIGALAAIVAHFYRDHDVVRNNPFERAVQYAGPAHSVDDRIPLSDHQMYLLISVLLKDDSISAFSRSVFWLIVTTGAAPSEAGGLALEDINLESECPHVWINENSVRGLKAKCRQRHLPLVGEALRLAPHLTERTCNPISVGATLNKHLKRAIPLLPKQSLYSIRHWMADRLRFIGATELEAKYILGHSRSNSHERYGAHHLNLFRLQELLTLALPANEVDRFVSGK